jgi:serine/threonine-protein kinase HSL1 (negative regulator of Swe1 kinase)
MDDLMDRKQNRAVSDPGKAKQAPNDSTVRLVSPDPMSPGVPLEPIQVRKKNKILMPLNSLRGGSSESSQTNYERGGYDPRVLRKHELDTIEEDPKSPKKKNTFGSTTAGKKWSWLGKRGVEQEDNPPTPLEKKSQQPLINPEQAVGKSSSEAPSNGVRFKDDIITSEEVQGHLENRKWFPKMFSRKEKAGFPLLTTDHAILQDGDDETESNASSEQQGKGKNVVQKSYPPATSVDAAAAASASQPIQINQNWFAKFFHIKPASRVLVLQINKAKARKEIVKKLKEWRKYGIRDVIVEKRAGGDVIRGRVDAQNCEFLPMFHLVNKY